MRTALRICIASALVATSAGVPWALQYQNQLKLRAGRESLEQQATRLSVLVQENERLSNLTSQAKAAPALTGEQLRELLRLRNERRWLGEQTNLVARLQTGDSRQVPAAPGGFGTELANEMGEAMKRILPALQPALHAYALAHSNEPPSDLSELEDFLPLVGGRKMAGLQIIEFVREEGPRPGDALLLRGNGGRSPGNGDQVRVYGFSDGRVVQVSSEDGHFDQWEAQHLNSPPAGTGEKVVLEGEGTARERARIAAAGAAVGIAAEDASRFDQLKQQQQAIAQKLEETKKSLTGSAEEQQGQMRAALASELSRLATETLGDKGPALVQKMLEPK